MSGTMYTLGVQQFLLSWTIDANGKGSRGKRVMNLSASSNCIASF